jgi:small multidrug resistance pump
MTISTGMPTNTPPGPAAERPLLPWMKALLRFAAVFNISAGLHMIVMYHETYKMIGMNKPDVHFPIQLVGLLVALFGVGYYFVARHPVRNRQMLLLGFWSKFLGSCLGTVYVLLGKLPLRFVAVFFFADVIYLPFFYAILRRLNRLANDD